MRNPLPLVQVTALRAVYEGDDAAPHESACRALKRRGYIAKGGTKSRPVWNITDAGQIILVAHEMTEAQP